MARETPVLLVLSLALVAHGLAERKCMLTGDWINDLGSTMTIGKVNKEGSFNGTFFTAVGDASDPIEPSPLLGYQKLINQPTFGFTISWSCSDSILVYMGQCFVDDRGQEVLRTMWLLRSHVDDINDDWKATRIGTNIFTRLRKPCERGWQQGSCQAGSSSGGHRPCSCSN